MTNTTTLVNEYKACRLRLEHMDQKLSSMLHSIQSFFWTAAAAAARDCDAENAVCWEFLQDLITCIQNDESCEYTVAKLESHVLKLKGQHVTCSPTAVHRETTARHDDVNQVSFTSADTTVNDENDDNESFTNNESHSCHCKQQQQHDDDKLIQLEQTVQRLQNELQQQAQDFALERMGDKARIELFHDHVTSKSFQDEHATRTIQVREDLQLALDISEQGRIRAVRNCSKNRELYAQKLQQLMRLAVQQATKE